MDIWVSSREQSGRSLKLAKNLIYFKVKEWVRLYFIPLYVFMVLRAKHLDEGAMADLHRGCLSQVGFEMPSYIWDARTLKIKSALWLSSPSFS